MFRYLYVPGPQVRRPETNSYKTLWFTFTQKQAIKRAPIPSSIWRRRFRKRKVLVRYNDISQ
jgi:hypothetical protein